MHGYYLAPLWLTASLVACGLFYLGTMAAIGFRLRRHHNEVWAALEWRFPVVGIPAVLRASTLSAFVFLRSQHRTMGDERLTVLIYIARASFAVTLFAAILAKVIGHQVYY
jgi:hypothetical protein